jgi:peroxiredoxin
MCGASNGLGPAQKVSRTCRHVRSERSLASALVGIKIRGVKALQTAQLLFAVAAAIGVFSFVRTAQDGELRRQCLPLCQVAPRYANSNRSLPAFELKRLDGGTVRSSDWKGQVVLLNFWSVTCTECKKELPALAQFAQTLRARGGAEVVTMTPDESEDEVRNMLAATVGKSLPFTVLMDPGGRVIRDLFGTKLYPETWFIDPRGLIRARIDGARDYTQPLYLEFVKNLSDASSCEIEFSRGQVRGEQNWLCDEANI